MQYEQWMAEYEAPSGAIWVCAACGKSGSNRAMIGDESCFLNAVLCHKEKHADGYWEYYQTPEPESGVQEISNS